MYRNFMQINSSIKSNNLGSRAFIFGGAYGNLQSTQAVLQKASELGFTSSEIIFTGDMIAYCANPVETIDLIKASVDHIIMGNCEEAIATGSNDCGCGFEEGSECSILSNQWYQFCKEQIDRETADWMGMLPRELEIEIAGFKFLATHASPSSINEFLFPSDNYSKVDIIEVDGYIVGHSGIPLIIEVNDKPWINSGASGMPANDGTPRIWYATIEAKDDSILIETHSLDYNYQDAQKNMQNASLSRGYINCLETGIWPSHDVLPHQERSLTGIPLKTQKKAFQKTPFSEKMSA